MCPGKIASLFDSTLTVYAGLTSPGARMEQEVEKNKAVAIYAEGKQHAIALGVMRLSTAEVYVLDSAFYVAHIGSRSINKDIGVDTISHIGDGLFQTSKTD